MKTLILILLYLPCFATKYSPFVTDGNCGLYGASPGDTIVVLSTANRYIAFEGLTGTASKRIKVISQHINSVNPFNLIYVKDCQYVDFIFDIEITNCTYRAVQITGIYNHCNMSGIKADGVADYFLFANHSLTTTNQYNTFSNMSVKNCNANVFMVGFSKGNNWKYTTFHDINIDTTFYGSCLVLENCFSTKVYNCRFTNIGLKETAHTAVIFIRGDGDIHDNIMANTWGNAYRAFGIGMGKIGNCKFYNNVFLKSRKYPACEINTQPGDTKEKGFYPANYLIENNVVSDIQASGYTDAAFDVYYALAGPVVIRGNICSKVGSLWHNGNNGAKVETINNIILP